MATPTSHNDASFDCVDRTLGIITAIMVESISNRPPTPSKRSTPPVLHAKKLSAESAKTLSGLSIKDPPRPAKEGYEWVWFPEGYWAEREIHGLRDIPRKTSDVTRLWKWRSRSSKSKSSSDDQRTMSLSPKSLHTPPGGVFSPVPPSPYLSEEAHVQSLQNRSAFRHDRSSSIGSRDASPLSHPRRQADRATNSDPPPPLPPTPTTPRKGLFSAARRGLHSAL